MAVTAPASKAWLNALRQTAGETGSEIAERDANASVSALAPKVAAMISSRASPAIARETSVHAETREGFEEAHPSSVVAVWHRPAAFGPGFACKTAALLVNYGFC